MTTKRESDDGHWLVMGRYAAWICGLSFLAALVVTILAEAGITAPLSPGREDPDAWFAYLEGKGPQLQLASAFFLLGFLALAPIGFGLWRSFAGGPSVNLMTAAFAASAIVGATGAVVQIGGITAILQAIAETPVETTEQLMPLSRYVWEPLIRAIFGTAFLLVASGLLLVGLLARPMAVFARGWRVLSLALGGLLLIGVIGLLLGERGFFYIAQGPGMMVLMPVWALWLARTFGHRQGSLTSRPRGISSANG